MPRASAKASGEPGIQTQLLRHLAARAMCLSVDELAVEMQTFSRRDIAKAAGKLVARDLIARKRTGCYVVSLHGKAAAAAGLEIKSGPKGRMTGTRAGTNSFQARLWRALRIQNKGTLNDFIALAEPGAMKNPHNSADQYFRALTLAGYVSVLARRRPGAAPTSPGFKVFVLIKNTGPRSPRFAKAGKFVRDLNTGEIINISLAEGMPQ
jgi:hypothetical protein